MQTGLDKKRALIIGGGIGGITTAIALQQAGLEVAVFEQAPALMEVGSALPLWTNALRALQQLGLGEVLDRMGASVTAGSISTWQGEKLVDMSTEVLLRRLGIINIVVHRAELLATLLAAFDADKVHLGATCIGFRQDESSVTACFADGREERGDLLIGADGLHSVVRSQMFGESKPIYAGYACWRGIAHTNRKDLETWAWGKGYQFGITPMSNGRAYWFAQFYSPEGIGYKPGSKKEEMLALFGKWHDPVPAVIEATDEQAILRNDVYESKSLRHWSLGRVTLVGDAAHTMTPNLGQGACQAIEDALVLAGCLKAEADVVVALKRYEKRRLQRTYRIRRLARLIGRVVQWRNPLVTRIRNAIMKMLPARLLLLVPMWILDHEAS